MNSITPFETSKQVSEFWRDYRTARELCSILEYKEYRNFLKVIKKAKDSCLNSGHALKKHFITITELVPTASGAMRKREDIKLSRYAAYLIVQNANPNKEIVAQGQSYFAEQTRKQELMQDPQFREDLLRVETRKELTDHQRELFSTAKKAWVKNYGSFQNAWYEGLYWGLDKKQINEKKWLKKNDVVFDYMSSEELGANLFRTTQTEAKLKRSLENWDKVGQKTADHIHFNVWEKIRATIHELWGTMPENLPAVEHIDEATKRLESYGILKDALPQQKTAIEDTLEKNIHTFPVPPTVPQINQLIEILRNNSWNIHITVWEKRYLVDQEWLEKIQQL